MILSIIVPMYNVERYIDRCLDSCFRQNISTNEYEIIAINDGSKDNSLAIAEKYAVAHSNIHVYSKTNGGLSSARNFGIEKANGDYIFFLDSDDWIADNSLQRVINKLISERPDVLCICSSRTDGNCFYDITSFTDTRIKTGPESLNRTFNPCAPFSIVRRDYLNEKNIRFVNGIYHEDSEYTPRVHYLASKISYLNGVVYYYFVNPNSIQTTPHPQKSYDYVDPVCVNLSMFQNNVIKQYKPFFDYQISLNLNNALSEMLLNSNQERATFQQFLDDYKYLYKHLCRSNILKYKIEGFLFKLFPKHSLSIYTLLQKIK